MGPTEDGFTALFFFEVPEAFRLLVEKGLEGNRH